MAKSSPVVSLLLFLTVLVVYLVNGRAIGSGDTLPTRYLPFSLLRQHDAALDEFTFLYDEAARRTFPLLDGIPYFLHYHQGRFVSAYSAGPALLALPIYAGPVLAGAPAREWAAGLEKLSASALTAASVVFLFWALAGLVARRWALGIAAVYAFGTSSWSVSSQALWPHGPSQLFLAVLLVALVRGMSDDRWLTGAGFAAAAASAMRVTDVLVAVPVLAWVASMRPRLTLRLAVAALAPLAGLALYNVWSFGSPAGPTGSTTAPTWAFFSQAPSLEGFWGTLLSPARGVFVYSPVFVFSVVGMLWGIARGPGMLTPLALGVVLVVLVVSQWFRWWGGYAWGPRLLADVTPILCFFLYPLTGALDRHRIVRAAFLLVVATSIAAHGLGAFFYDARWDNQVDVDRNPAALWSWTEGPLVFYGRQAVAAVEGVLSAGRSPRPTSVDAPQLLAASYAFRPIAPGSFIGETLAVSVTARNTGRAVWLAAAPGGRGAVRLGWRWSRRGVVLEEGRASLPFDVPPGRSARFAERISVPAVPGTYALTIGLVSELVTWLADPASVAVVVSAADLEQVLSTPIATGERGPTATISTDRAVYGRGDTIHLTVQLRNPRRPGQVDAYLVGRATGGDAWFFDGRRLFRLGESDWVAWSRKLPMPARATGRFTMPASALPSDTYRWHVVVTESGTRRCVARAATELRVEP